MRHIVAVGGREKHFVEAGDLHHVGRQFVGRAGGQRHLVFGGGAVHGGDGAFALGQVLLVFAQQPALDFARDRGLVHA